ncbi:hypothetical protein ACIOGZ_29220 [Kitasatospora sp. NPDC088160]|uniref:hypothetical protein n=1 Tax=Kitasatospora sp. NPDC088160 TaxID=3364072 RepID=UPI0038242BCB
MKRTLTALVVSAALSCSALAAAPPAAAVSVGTCTGSTTTTYTPGLTDTLQTITANGTDNADLCVILGHPWLTSFVGPFNGTQSLSCTSILTSGSGTETLEWNTGQDSQWSWTNDFQNVDGAEVGTATGPITSGPLTGTTLTQVIVLAPGSLAACSTTTGVTQVSGSSNWEFT